MAEKGFSELDNMEDLVYTAIQAESGVRWGGYKRELITQNLSMLEESIVVCSVCAGIMHSACSIKGGLAQVCESCVGEDTAHQPVGPIRAIVAKLGCRCPLLDRDCEWTGTLGSMVHHMSECNQFIVQCPYIKYGCKRELKRGELEKHRKETKEFHTEVLSIFMADKVERLEEEKKQQTAVIQRIEEEKKQQTAVIQKLESALDEFIQMKDYFKLNGIVWTVVNRHDIINKIYQLRSQPQTAVANQENLNAANYTGDAIYSQWNGTVLQGPRFVIHTFYYFYPTLTTQVNPNATLTISSYNIAQCTQYVQWPFTGKCKIVLVNQENPEDSWIYEKENFQVQNGGSFQINLPFDTLLDEKYNKDGTFVFRIFINPFCQNFQ